MTDSSDSDEESNNKLKEAIAPELIQCMTPKNPESFTNKGKLPSLRKEVCDQSNANGNILNTTPEFRNHVSKKLSAYLESVIELENTPQRSSSIKTQSMDYGVKLLHTSKNIVKDDHGSCETKRTPKIKQRKQSGSSENDSDAEAQKVSEAVVSGMDVLKGGEGAFASKTEPMIATKSMKKLSKKKKRRCSDKAKDFPKKLKRDVKV